MQITDIPNINLELFGPVNMYLAMGVQILVSLLLGGMIGWEREMKGKAAGTKTNILICLGSCLYTAMSMLHLQEAPMGDPNRVAAQVVSGIGFLGAGAILQGKGGVTGLTTAATIWTVAAIGVAVGYGYPVTAALFTFTVLIVLRILEPLFSRLEPHEDVHFVVQGKGDVASIVENALQQTDAVIYHSLNLGSDESGMDMHYYMRISVKQLKFIEGQLRQLGSIRRVQHQKLHELPDFIEEEEG